MRKSMKKDEVEAVFRAKTVFTTSHFVIRWRRTDLAFPRVSFAFSRAVGPAVARNRFKRRLRVVVAEAAAKRGFDAVISAKKPLRNLTEDAWRLEREKISRFCAEHSQSSRPSAS